MDVEMREMFQLIFQKLDSIDHRMGALETRMDSMENRMGALETRMDSMENRMGALETRMDHVESDITYIKLTIENDIGRSLKVLAEGHQLLSQKLEKVDSIAKDVDELKGAIIAVESITAHNWAYLVDSRKAV